MGRPNPQWGNSNNPLFQTMWLGQNQNRNFHFVFSDHGESIESLKMYFGAYTPLREKFIVSDN